MRFALLLALVVCAWASCAVASPGIFLEHAEAQQFEHSLASWPAGEVMPLLAVPDELTMTAHIEAFDEPEKDHSLAEVAGETEGDAETETETETQTETETEAATEGEVQAEAEQETQADAETEVAADAESDVAAETETDASAATEVQTEAEAESEATAETETQAEAESTAEAETQVDAEAEADATADAEATVDADATAEAAAEAELTASLEAQSEQLAAAEADFAAEAEVVAGAEAEANALTAQLAAQGISTEMLTEVESATSAENYQGLAHTAKIPGSGCGSGLTTYIVPDFNMHNACVTHDQCYDTCGSRKQNCDSSFYVNMKAICAKKYAGTTLAKKAGKKICDGQAYLYYRAVVKLGARPFSNAQTASCPRK